MARFWLRVTKGIEPLRGRPGRFLAFEKLERRQLLCAEDLAASATLAASAQEIAPALENLSDSAGSASSAEAASTSEPAPAISAEASELPTDVNSASDGEASSVVVEPETEATDEPGSDVTASENSAPEDAAPESTAPESSTTEHTTPTSVVLEDPVPEEPAGAAASAAEQSASAEDAVASDPLNAGTPPVDPSENVEEPTADEQDPDDEGAEADPVAEDPLATNSDAEETADPEPAEFGAETFDEDEDSDEEEPEGEPNDDGPEGEPVEDPGEAPVDEIPGSDPVEEEPEEEEPVNEPPPEPEPPVEEDKVEDRPKLAVADTSLRGSGRESNSQSRQLSLSKDSSLARLELAESINKTLTPALHAETLSANRALLSEEAGHPEFQSSESEVALAAADQIFEELGQADEAVLSDATLDGRLKRDESLARSVQKSTSWITTPPLNEHDPDVARFALASSTLPFEQAMSELLAESDDYTADFRSETGKGDYSPWSYALAATVLAGGFARQQYRYNRLRTVAIGAGSDTVSAAFPELLTLVDFNE